ncbi:hypothetical protein EAX61_03165 [Dokdonia sinensis]|uniref:DUF4625 domain-containing protein n=1 Tax=Dokdonia sinensis TaxID=2479847 RepID=A0A3M0GER2_9FLAO|nr:hypothetical protein [Dokdonia sinensis]RMB63405.1 hypothetical protein EAX61_03165 [Dokdonia sinensis]
MKKILIVLVLAFVAMSCSDDDAQMFFFELVPTASVENVPEKFILNQADTLVVRFARPSICHSFQGFEFEREGNTRKIAVVTRVLEGGDQCVDPDEEDRVVPFIFRPEATGTVVLRFFQGDDADGEQQFLDIEVPIEEE